MAMPGRRLRIRGDEGMTLVELLVAMFVMGFVALVFTSVLASVQRGVVHQDMLSRTLDQARLAVQQLDREIRSGNVLYDPARENNGVTSCTGCLPGYTLRVYTQSNATTRGGYRCGLWQIDSQQRLLVRYWPPGDPGSATAWRVVATGVVNRALSEPAFALETDPLKGDRTINITLAVNEDLTHRPGQTVRVRASLTGRNTSYDYPLNVCSTVPA
jgi:prepilin-type N-terminal cleavage/methylation domain-containing protein